jgi:hypothetical protein
MRVGKTLGRGASQSPHSRRPSNLAPLVGEFDQAFHFETIEMLAHGHRRNIEASSDLRRSLRPPSLELEENALLRTRIMFHQNRWYLPRIISQVIA